MVSECGISDIFNTPNKGGLLPLFDYLAHGAVDFGAAAGGADDAKGIDEAAGIDPANALKPFTSLPSPYSSDFLTSSLIDSEPPISWSVSVTFLKPIERIMSPSCWRPISSAFGFGFLIFRFPNTTRPWNDGPVIV